jgi:hypothetical protein
MIFPVGFAIVDSFSPLDSHLAPPLRRHRQHLYHTERKMESTESPAGKRVMGRTTGFSGIGPGKLWIGW